MAIMSSLRGRAMLTTRSVYLNTSTIISSSVSGAGLPSGCVHGWTMPFISTVWKQDAHEHGAPSMAPSTPDARYKQSTSNPFGFGSSYLTGMMMSSPSVPVHFVGVSSCTRETRGRGGRRGGQEGKTWVAALHALIVLRTHQSWDTFSRASGRERGHPAVERASQ